ncbi:hypothetical protein JW711_02120 [Candidatus Woesearchaeota archaeon]|nr:hypothetical protein [Candidatus Woesearchaeota archaeon]
MYDVELEGERQALCERCRKFVPLSQIRYVAKGNDSKMALCVKCLGNFRTAAPTPVKNMPAQESPSGMKAFYCERCKYRFKFNTNKDATLRCPYCGRTDKIISEEKRSAGHIVEKADF